MGKVVVAERAWGNSVQSKLCKVPEGHKGVLEFHALCTPGDHIDPSFELRLEAFLCGEDTGDSTKWEPVGFIVYRGGVYERPGIPGFKILSPVTVGDKEYDLHARFRGKYVGIKISTNRVAEVGAEVEL